MSVRSRQLPEKLQGPVGFLSLLFSIGGFVLGYILVLLGITLYFDMNGFGDKITNFESLVVVGFGAVALVIGYAGWRGFLRFSY